MSGYIRHVHDTFSIGDTVLTCPEDGLIEILQVHVVYTASATAGNRRLIATILDENSTEMANYHAGAQQSASTVRHYTLARGITRENNFVDDSLHMSIPVGTVLLRNWELQITDTNGVDLENDGHTTTVIYEETSHDDGGTVT